MIPDIANILALALKDHADHESYKDAVAAARGLTLLAATSKSNRRVLRLAAASVYDDLNEYKTYIVHRLFAATRHLDLNVMMWPIHVRHIYWSSRRCFGNYVYDDTIFFDNMVALVDGEVPEQESVANSVANSSVDHIYRQSYEETRYRAHSQSTIISDSTRAMYVWTRRADGGINGYAIGDDGKTLVSVPVSDQETQALYGRWALVEDTEVDDGANVDHTYDSDY